MIQYNNCKYPKANAMEEGKFNWFYIDVVKHELYHEASEEAECDPSPNYSFISCIQSYKARKVGCRLPWDLWSPSDIPLCKSLVEFDTHEKFDIILMNEEKKLILNETKCLVPCIYKEYKLVNHNPLIGSGKELFGNKSLKLVNLNKR